MDDCDQLKMMIQQFQSVPSGTSSVDVSKLVGLLSLLPTIIQMLVPGINPQIMAIIQQVIKIITGLFPAPTP